MTVKREPAVLLFFGLWIIVLLGRLMYLGSAGRAERIRTCEALSRATRSLPARRGTIYDRHRRALAWSELAFDLYAAGERIPRSADAVLVRLWGTPPVVQDDFGLLRRNLTGAELSVLEPLVKAGRFLTIRPRLERRWVGDVRLREAAEAAELKFDAELRGTPGVCSVMLDRFGHWIPGTMQILRAPVPGRDVTLNVEVRQ